MTTKVTATDTGTGEEQTVEITDNYVLIREGTCYLEHTQVCGDGTNVLTVRGVRGRGGPGSPGSRVDPHPASQGRRLLPHDRCPVCGHDLHEHFLDFGCLNGWEWADGVIVSEEGCDCSLTLCRGRGGRPSEGDR